MSYAIACHEPYTPLALLTLLPGPGRKRVPQLYGYRLTYRNPDRNGPGCVMAWEITGGRMTYQVALERNAVGNLHFHCTCADAVYRAEGAGRFCKHIRGLCEFAHHVSGIGSTDTAICA